MSRVISIIVALLIGVTATTFASTTTFAYDAPLVARVELRTISVSGSAKGQVAASHETAASRSSVDTGTSTPVATFVAANTVDDIGATTVHGAERVAGGGATRGGVLSPEQVVKVRSTGQVFKQTNGATARVLQGADGRFSVVVDGRRGLITTFQNLSQNSLDRLAKNYGWVPE